MESLERLEGRLGSLRELRTIVKTMKALSAASIRQYENAVESLASYDLNIELGLYVVLQELPAGRLERSAAGAGRHAGIVFGSDHGLCGRFNEAVAEYAVGRADGSDGPPSLLVAVGERVGATLLGRGAEIAATWGVPGSAETIVGLCERLLVLAERWRRDEQIGAVTVYFNHRTQQGGYKPDSRRLLPVDLARLGRRPADGWPSRRLPAYSMQRERLLRRLLRQHLFVTLFRACAESQASEHTSRLRAMQSAERNLDERLDEVTMTYRRARQGAITSELLDVVSGFEALTHAGDRAGSAPEPARHR
ncbi:F0F1 ATP synthase subunit gamma [Thioalkalivibrio sp. XN8]|uniref:F0F1 ATP synthase subunit gamma n=1 Tax=Thioalkalivibrio sp. XN8 TaxID=2712863 RepID=UPI0013EC3FF2|nr:F0F1 ATP synthase subunit gamma [Thioalkalivibrio sp. XN8]NGP54503.1 F0F1 ATP synthase subunit gamma [Thioalkalivibrio sp. XN8]